VGTIPKLLFSYWSGDNISLLHNISLLSAIKLNPDFKVILYTAKEGQACDTKFFTSGEQGVDFFTKIRFEDFISANGLECITIDFEKEYGISGPRYHTFLADLIRIKKLYEHGGFWFDLDVLFLNPIPKEFLLSSSESKTCVLTSYDQCIPTGFIGGVPRCSIFEIASAFLDSYLSENARHMANYQSIGPNLWTRILDPYLDEMLNDHPSVFFVEPRVIYPYLWNEIALLFNPHIGLRISSRTVCVHWFNGAQNTRDFLNQFNFSETIKTPTSPFTRILKRLQEKSVFDADMLQRYTRKGVL